MMNFQVTSILSLVLLTAGCSLNPLFGVVNNLKIEIVRTNKSDVSVSASDNVLSFDCIMVNVTGYGIEQIANISASEIPFDRLSLGYENMMINPAEVDDGSKLNLSVTLPMLQGVDASEQPRLIQILGIKKNSGASCKGKKLSDYLKNENPNAGLYVVGTTSYPTTNAQVNCQPEKLCIVDEVSLNGLPKELIQQTIEDKIFDEVSSFSRGIAYATQDDFLYTGTLFDQQDLETHGNPVRMNSLMISKPSSPNKVSRIDWIIPFSDYEIGRLNKVNLLTGIIRSENYQKLSPTACSGTNALGTYSNIEVKLWDANAGDWQDPYLKPTNSSLQTAVLLSNANQSTYGILGMDLASMKDFRYNINGIKYLIISFRSQNVGAADCPSLNINNLRLQFPN